MAGATGRLLLALAAVLLHQAVGQSVLQCPLNDLHFNGGNNALVNSAQAQAVQWCRFAEGGPNSFVNGVNKMGTRFWGAPNVPDSAFTTTADATNALAGLVLLGKGDPVSRVGPSFNETCSGPNAVALNSTVNLDGKPGPNYFAASLACAQNNAGQFNPTQCPVSVK